MQEHNSTIQQFNNLRIALVHDFLLYPGGAEKVLETLVEMFPEAPIYTLLYDEEGVKGRFQGKDIRTSFLQKLPRFLRKHHRWLLPFYGTAVETFNLRDFDLVISSSGAWSKGIVTKLNTKHIAYIHSPMRFAWEKHGTGNIKHKTNNIILRFLLSYLRIWDKLAAERPDYLIANSKYTEERIRKYYRRDSVVIYPPVDAPQSSAFPSRVLGIPSKPSFSRAANSYKLKAKSYFLIVSRLSPYKRIDLAVEAFNKLDLPLVIIGEGAQEKYLRKIAKSNIKILGWQDHRILTHYFQNARAFIFPSVDDFGIAPVEAMSYGLPVIAMRKGGAKETVEENVSGIFFESQTPEVLADAVRRFIDVECIFNKEEIKKRAEKLNKARFKENLNRFFDDLPILNDRIKN